MAGVFDPAIFDSGVFDVDAGAVTDDFSLDAVILKTQSGGFDLDAVIQATQSDSFDLDAVLVAGTTETFSVDAVVLRTESASGSADAVILASFSETADLDAFIADSAVEEEFSLDAVLSAGRSDDFGLSAYILGQGHSRLADHFGEQDDTTITVESELLRDVLADLFATAYGISVPSGRFGLYAFVLPYLTLDAVLHVEQAASFGLDARVARGASFGLSAVFEEIYVDRFSLNAIIVDD